MNQYFVELIGPRRGWPFDMSDEEKLIMQMHSDYFKDLTAKKKCILAGPCFELRTGIGILQTETEAEAISIMKNDPSIKQGINTFQMHPMHVGFLVENLPPDRYVKDPTDEIVRKEAVIAAALSEVWKAWTTTDGVKTFFSSSAKVELRMGGPYEIYFLLHNDYGMKGSEDCRVLSYLPMEMISFEWNAPPEFGHLREIRTQVIVQFEQIDSRNTRVILSHLGWGRGEDWGSLFTYFDHAWGYVLDNLKRRFEQGPIEWERKQGE